MRDETKLLLSCTNLFLENKESIKTFLEKEINWETIKNAAIRHRVTPLLCRTLKNIDSDKIPQGFMGSIRKSFLANASRNTFLFQELKETKSLLESNQITPIFFKGAAIAAQAYNDLSLREFDDIDILVPKKDILKTRDLLLAKGYTSQVELTPAQSKAFLASDRDWAFIHHEKRTIIDINSTIMPAFFSFKMDYDDILSSAKPVSIEGIDILAPSIETMIVILSAHGTYHVWSRLAWIADLANIITTNKDINWEKVVTKANKTHSKRMLLLGTSLANRLLELPVPKELQPLIDKDLSITDLGDTAIVPLIADIEEDEAEKDPAWLFIIKSRERLWDRINYILQYLFIPTYSDWKLYTLPEPLFFIYYLTRPFRLIAKVLLK